MKNQEANKFYQILQKQFSRRINLDLSRIKYFLFKKKIYPNQIEGEIITVKGSDGKNSVVQSLKAIFIENKKKITTFTSPGIISPLDRIFIKDKFISFKKFKNISKKIIKFKKLKQKRDSTILLRVLREGKINFSKSNTRLKKCKEYYFNHENGTQKIWLIVESCENEAEITSYEIFEN